MNLAETGHAWFTLAELAGMGLPDVPTTKRALQHRANAQNWLAPEKEGLTWRKRKGAGGGYEFTPYVLPLAARAKLAVAAHKAAEPTQAEKREKEELWRRYEALPDVHKAKAIKALSVIQAVETLCASGTRKTYAIMMVAQEAGVGHTTINNWYRDLRGLNRCDWLPALAPKYSRFTEQAECASRIWDFIRTDYLRPEKPNFSDCYSRAESLAKAEKLPIPSAKTLMRRFQKLNPAILILGRDGQEALTRKFPPQERDRTFFYALEAVNADGHEWDVFVKWPDGTVGRPVMVGFQDLYSGMILSWRVDRSENTEVVRLAFGDMVSEWGIPERCYLDNGRNFASKWLTGGTPTRYRFKVRDEEPDGIMVQLGVDVRWTTPYSGQSKPIERAWRDFAQRIAKHPAFAGAYSGNRPTNKPENYGSHAVPLDVFLTTIAAEIREHNARTGRKSKTCGGKLSFLQAFKASYENAQIRKATEEQARLWLMAAESIRADKVRGEIKFAGNRYWCEDLLQVRGETCVVRFDPQDYHAGIHVYRSNGSYLASAACIEAAGFSDRTAAQDHNRARKQWKRATKEALAAELKMSIAEVAQITANYTEESDEPIEAKVVRPVFSPGSAPTRGNAALALLEASEEDLYLEKYNEMVRPDRQRFQVISSDD